MNKKEISAILSNFNSTAGAQLKYYLIASLFPEMKDTEIQKLLGIASTSSFARVKSAVRELDLPPLVSSNLEVTSEEAGMDEAESAELVALKEENERLKNKLELKIRTIQIEEQTIKSCEDKIANLKDFIRKTAESRETMVQHYQQTIERLQEQGIDLAPLLFNPYRKEMKELLE